MKKDLAIIVGLFLLIVAILLFSNGYSSISFFGPPRLSVQNAAKTTNVTVKTLSIKTTIATTLPEREAGLSGKDSMPISEGELFVFDGSDYWAIWMKNMKFPIDIIWISSDKKIVDIAPSVLPEPGKKDSDLHIYKPSSKAQYVLEINAGLSKANNLQIGDSVNFQL